MFQHNKITLSNEQKSWLRKEICQAWGKGDAETIVRKREGDLQDLEEGFRLGKEILNNPSSDQTLVKEYQARERLFLSEYQKEIISSDSDLFDDIEEYRDSLFNELKVCYQLVVDQISIAGSFTPMIRHNLLSRGVQQSARAEAMLFLMANIGNLSPVYDMIIEKEGYLSEPDPTGKMRPGASVGMYIRSYLETLKDALSILLYE